MRLLRGSLWTTLGFFQIINNNPTGAQIKLTREHFVSKFRYNFLSFKVALYSPRAAFKTTPVRVNSKRLIMWFFFYDNVWIFVLSHKCTATENLKNVTQMTKCYAKAKRFLTINVNNIKQCQKYVKLMWTLEGNPGIFTIHNDIYGSTFFMPAQCAKG